MLVGIKNTNLDPIWIKTLPSGIAVYRSVFRDIWGSNLVFAGPHRTFSNVNRVCTISHSIVETHPITNRSLSSEMVAATMTRLGNLIVGSY